MECNICFESLDKHTSYITPCIHKFCIYCIKKWSETRYQYTSVILCPVCRHIIDIHNIRTMYNDMMDKKTIQEHMSNLNNQNTITILPLAIQAKPLALRGKNESELGKRCQNDENSRGLQRSFFGYLHPSPC